MSKCGIVVRKRRNEFFPNGGNRNSQRWKNDPKAKENHRRLHGQDPLIPARDPLDDPCREKNREDKKSDIPI